MSGIVAFWIKGDAHELLSVRLVNTNLKTAAGARRRARAELARRGFPPLREGWKPRAPIQSPGSWLCEWRRTVSR